MNGTEMTMRHASDCAVHNEPAMPAGECNCGAAENPALYESGRWDFASDYERREAIAAEADARARSHIAWATAAVMIALIVAYVWLHGGEFP